MDGAYVINLDVCKSKGTHRIALYVNGNNITYFVSFGVELIPKRNKKKIINSKNIQTYFHRMEANDSIMCDYFCVGFIDFKG